MVFFPTLREIKGYVKLRPSIKIDNLVFQLHYRLAFGVLVLSVLLLAKDSYFGQKIDCHYGSTITPPFVNHFCWLTGPYLVESALNKKVGVEVAAPGVTNPKPGEKLISYYYYQWIVFILGIQAAAFYSTHLVWKLREGGQMSLLVSPIISLKVDNESKKPGLMKRAAQKVCFRMGNFQAYFRFYVIMEFVNVVHVLLEIFLTNYVLNGFFLTYGYDVIMFMSLSSEEKQNAVNPMTRAFPLLTKCTFHRSGPEGGIETVRPLCQLPLNIMNERIFLVLWFLYLFLLVVSSYILIYRLLIIFSKRYRYYVLYEEHCKGYIDKSNRKLALNKCTVSDWWILHMIARNLNDDDFVDFIGTFAKTIEEKERNTNKVREKTDKVEMKENKCEEPLLATN